MTTETNETNQPSPKLLALIGVWDWTAFQTILPQYADDAVLASEFIDKLYSDIMLAGVSPGFVSFQLQVEPLPLDRPSTVKLSIFPTITATEHTTEKNIRQATKTFTFKLTEVDGIPKLQMSQYVESGTSAARSDLVFTAPTETPADSKDWLKTAMTHDKQTCVDLTPTLPELTMRPLQGWLKNVAEKQHFSFNELKVLLLPAFERDIDYADTMSLLVTELDGEMRVLDKDHLAFTLILSPSSIDQYDMVSIIYRSQRLNAAEGKNVLHIDCKLNWGEARIIPVIVPALMVTQKIEYTGGLIQHAMIAKQFEFQRIAAQLSNDESITERLEVFFNREESIVGVLLADLEKIGISHLINRITLSMVDAPKSAREQVQVMITFFNEGIVKVAEVLQGWVYDEGSNDFLPTADFDTIKVNTEKLMRVTQAVQEKAAGKRPKLSDLGHFNLGDKMRTIPDHVKEKQVHTQGSFDRLTHGGVELETPVETHGELNITLTFKDLSMPTNFLGSLTRYGHDLVACYNELSRLLSGSMRLDDGDDFTLTLSGVLDEGLRSYARIIMRLGVKRSYLLGNGFTAEVVKQLT
jgi:hypothetical protein